LDAWPIHIEVFEGTYLSDYWTAFHFIEVGDGVYFGKGSWGEKQKCIDSDDFQ
jgi:hypothetical protein